MGVIVWYILISFLIIRNNKQERIAGGGSDIYPRLKRREGKSSNPPPLRIYISLEKLDLIKPTIVKSLLGANHLPSIKLSGAEP